MTPIEDPAMMHKWLDAAREHDRWYGHRGGVSWYLLLVLGFNTALRIGDLCTLKVKDVRGVERVTKIAEKTGKEGTIKLQDATRRVLERLLEGRDGEEYVLLSRQKGSRTGRRAPITRQRAYAIIREIARQTGYEGRVGCHTMRKTWALNYYHAGGDDLAMVQKALRHTSQEATLHYLGLDQKRSDETVDKMVTMV